jgi:hypothetical protein
MEANHKPAATATSAPEAALPIDEVSTNPTAFPPTATSVRIDIPRPRQTAEDRQFVEAMSAGLAALENRQWLAAQDAFSRASRLRPDAPEVDDGLTRARAGQRRELASESLRRARGFEENEAWREAEKMYLAVLAIEPASAPALDGVKRTKTRADLDEKLEFHLANPGRLATQSVFEDAASTLEEALETRPSGPRLERQIAALESVLARASTPVAVILESDDSTDVTVYRIGRLGTFVRRELNLRPGTYTVVGSRPGYRDVRVQLNVTPDTPSKPLVIKCSERL